MAKVAAAQALTGTSPGTYFAAEPPMAKSDFLNEIAQWRRLSVTP